MANYNNLKAGIDAVIKTNGRQEISGAALNAQLKNMITELGAGYQYMGVATPATNPGTPDANVFYLASEAGTYTNFGGIVINEGEVCALVWNGIWTKQVTGAATADQLNQLGQEMSEDINSVVGGDISIQLSLTSIGKIIPSGVSPNWSNASSGVVEGATMPFADYARKTIKIIANSLGYAQVAFLKENYVVGQEKPQFATTENSRISIATNDFIIIDVPADCTYLYVQTLGDGIDRTPQAISYYDEGLIAPINSVYNDTQERVKNSSISSIGAIIYNGHWNSADGAYTQGGTIPISKYAGLPIAIKANASYNSTIAFLKENYSQGDYGVDFCDNTSTIVLTPNSESVYNIPLDCKYLYVQIFGDGNNRIPQSIYISVPSINTRLERLEDSEKIVIDCWGDSLTQSSVGIYPGELAEISGLPVRNYGDGGESALQIAGRHGGCPACLKEDLSVPASGSVAISLKSSFNDWDYAAGTHFLEQRNSGINPCCIGGIIGELSYSANGTIFTRSEAGDAKIIKAGELVYPRWGENTTNHIQVIWIGQNVDGSFSTNDELVEIVRNMIQYYNNNKFLAVCYIQRGGGVDAVIAAENAFKKAFGLKSFCPREYLNHFGIEKAVEKGYIQGATVQDEQDIANGLIPTSLRRDAVHLNSYGYKLVAQRIYELLSQNGCI